MEVFQSQQWSRDAQFSSFWAHYKAVEKWRADHVRMASAACRLAYEKRNYYRRGKAFTNKHVGRPNRDPMKISHRRYTQSRISYEHNSEPSDMDAVSVTDDDKEMSEEMVEFFKKTIEHRKNRAAERATRDQCGTNQQGESTAHWIQLPDDEYISADKIGVHGVPNRTFAVPNEAERNNLRRESARLLYGRNAERILAMETLVDMRFEQEFARKRPPLWPNIPLKF